MVVIHGTQTLPVVLDVSEAELGRAIMALVDARLGGIDDAGCDWSTTPARHTVIAHNPRWIVSRDPLIATLVDAANILIYGEPDITPEEQGAPDAA